MNSPVEGLGAGGGGCSGAGWGAGGAGAVDRGSSSVGGLSSRSWRGLARGLRFRVGGFALGSGSGLVGGASGAGRGCGRGVCGRGAALSGWPALAAGRARRPGAERDQAGGRQQRGQPGNVPPTALGESTRRARCVAPPCPPRFGRGERAAGTRSPHCYRPAADGPLYDLMLLDRRQRPRGPPPGDVSRGGGHARAPAGTIVGRHDWGSRRIAYEIDHRPEAAYHLFQFEGDNALLDRLNHSLRIMDGVLRFRIIRQPPGPAPCRPSPEPPRARRDEEPDGRVAARAAADAPPDGQRGRGRGRGAPPRLAAEPAGVSGSGARRDRLGRAARVAAGAGPDAAPAGLRGRRVTPGRAASRTYLRLSRIRHHWARAGKVVRMRLRPLGGQRGAASARAPRTSTPSGARSPGATTGPRRRPRRGLRLVWDLGANIGLTMADLAERHPGARIVGVELDAENAALARGQHGPVGDALRGRSRRRVWPDDGEMRYVRLARRHVRALRDRRGAATETRR